MKIGVPMFRIRPEQMATVARRAPVLFLSSPLAARHVTGEVITVTGGMEGRTLWSKDEIDEAAVRRRRRED